MYTHNNISFIKTIFSEIKTNSPEVIYYNKNKFPALFNGITNYVKNMSVKIVDDAKLLQEFSKLTDSNAIDAFGQNYKFDLENKYSGIEDIFLKSLGLIREQTPWIYDLYQLFDIIFFPIIKNDYEDGSSSSPQTFGFIYVNFYNRKNRETDIVDLASRISHEIAHQVLSIYQYYDKIILNSNFQSYSPLRKTKRPIVCALDACLAASYMISVMTSYKTNNASVAEVLKANIIDIVKNMAISLQEIKNNAQFTDIGENIYNEIIENLKEHNSYYSQ